MHTRLLEITEKMPMKRIMVNGKPYLDRYYCRTLSDGRDVWLHHFRSADGDRHLHNHPFDAVSIMLAGSYTQELLRDGAIRLQRSESVEYGFFVNALLNFCGGAKESFLNIFSQEEKFAITPFVWHRIAEVEPDTWTIMIVKPERLPFWYFKDGDKLEPVASSPRDWWKSRGTRGEHE